MRKVCMVLCVLSMLACNRVDPNGLGMELGPMGLKTEADTCDRKMVIKPVRIDTRHVAFYKLDKIVREAKDALNNQTFVDLGKKPVFDFSVAKLFPVYKNEDFIYAGLNYNIEAIESLEWIFNTLDLKSKSANTKDVLIINPLLEYISDGTVVLRKFLNNQLDEDALERLKVNKTAEELTKIYFYLRLAIESRAHFIDRLSELLIDIASNNLDRDTIVSSIITNVLAPTDLRGHSIALEFNSFSSGEIYQYYVSMQAMIQILSCFVKP
ncbi:hypothetical protein bcCo53_001153 (plasmid) [Borrelia coriaceae]|nr:hypothetical protein [Borrelia coriaceae]UPA16985.1 hypothetical protein bcCo53_001153 [Borrelia coriaceae]